MTSTTKFQLRPYSWRNGKPGEFDTLRFVDWLLERARRKTASQPTSQPARSHGAGGDSMYIHTYIRATDEESVDVDFSSFQRKPESQLRLSVGATSASSAAQSVKLHDGEDDNVKVLRGLRFALIELTLRGGVVSPTFIRSTTTTTTTARARRGAASVSTARPLGGFVRSFDSSKLIASLP